MNNKNLIHSAISVNFYRYKLEDFDGKIIYLEDTRFVSIK